MKGVLTAGVQFGIQDMQASTVVPGSDWITWSGQSATLDDVTVTNNDPGAGNVNLIWTADPVAGVSVDFIDATVQNPTVTMTKSVPTGDATVVTLTLTATQAGKQPGVSSMMVDVYDDICKASLASGSATIGPGDFNRDCITGLKDLSLIAVLL